MNEVTYLPEVECTVRPGFFERELSVAVQDPDRNATQYVRVPKGLVAEVDGKHYLAVGVVQVDYEHKKALVELPNEADSGVNRIWAPFHLFRQEVSKP
jgi:hypothetical protein